MNRIKLKAISDAVKRMNDLKTAGRPHDSLRYEIIPRLVMDEIDFFSAVLILPPMPRPAAVPPVGGRTMRRRAGSTGGDVGFSSSLIAPT